MSAPRPSEADVEALATEEWHVPFCGSGLAESDFERRRCVDLDDLRACLAARYAEHEREVAALRAEVERNAAGWRQAFNAGISNQDRAEAAERALADLLGQIRALDRSGRMSFDHSHLRALLPRDDAAGGAS